VPGIDPESPGFDKVVIHIDFGIFSGMEASITILGRLDAWRKEKQHARTGVFVVCF
jgi:hypothetical protein